jgi:lysyl-tRNA synthetase class 2
MEQVNISLDEQERIRREKLLKLQKAGNDPFEIVKFDKTHNSNVILENFETMNGKKVSVAGRIVLKRVMGKASFVHILDEGGKIQMYVAVDDVGDKAYEAFRDFDLGDIVGAKGKVFKTKTGETTVHVNEITLLCKSVKPLPDKYHGLKDADLRFRERYVDLIVNPEVKNIFITRSKIIKSIREFLDARGYLEVETPILQTVAGGAEARPFVTHHNALNLNMYLRIANELHLKRLIIGGFEKVYEMGRMFRNEGISYKHNPEFTNIELYQSYADYNDMMDLTEELFKTVMQKSINTTKIDYEGHSLDFTKSFKRITMVDAVKEVLGLDFKKLDAKTALKELKKVKGYETPRNSTWGEVLYSAFDQFVEKTLIQPTFVIDHPIEISPLTKKKKGDPRLTERFELFVLGRELANAYSELNDPIDQRARFEAQMVEREKGNDEAQMMDNDFLNAICYGMPPTGGLGIGVDRFIMMLTGVHSIRECLLFPTMKPIE